MKRKKDNLEKNISRLVKRTSGSDEPGRAFTDSLIDKALGEIKEPARRRFVPFTRLAWIGAAAVLVIGLLVVVPYLVRENVPGSKVAKDFKVPTEQMRSKEAAEVKSAVDVGKKDFPEKEPPFALAKEETKASDDLGAEGSIAEKPPFAPASAIELVTLPRRDKVQITIYNSADLTLVRERRNLTLKKGWNWLQFMWANTLIDPTSLNLEPLEQRDKIDIQQLVFPARLRELGRWLIRSQVSGQVPFEITYFTSGLSWRAFYMGTLSEDERKMKLAGYVRVENRSGEDYENAQTRLIVGKLHILDEIAELARRQYPYGRPAKAGDRIEGFAEREFDEKSKLELGRMAQRTLNYFGEKPKEIIKEGLSEYFLYTIEGTETIADKWGRRLLSFEAEDVPVKSLYKYDEQRWGQQTIRYIAFANDEGHRLGNTPIPDGDVKIYGLADEQGHLSYIGGTSVKYIPVGEEVELNLGPARLVKVEPKLMEFETDNYVFDSNDNITGWDEVRSWQIEVTNTSKLAAEVEITRDFETAYWTLQIDGEGVFYEKHDATHARFKMTIQPQSKRIFKYTVRTYYGVREEVAAKINNKR